MAKMTKVKLTQNLMEKGTLLLKGAIVEVEQEKAEKWAMHGYAIGAAEAAKQAKDELAKIEEEKKAEIAALEEAAEDESELLEDDGVSAVDEDEEEEPKPKSRKKARRKRG